MHRYLAALRAARWTWMPGRRPSGLYITLSGIQCTLSDLLSINVPSILLMISSVQIKMLFHELLVHQSCHRKKYDQSKCPSLAKACRVNLGINSAKTSSKDPSLYLEMHHNTAEQFVDN